VEQLSHLRLKGCILVAETAAELDALLPDL
jgi:hypothetical protein